MAKKRTMFSPKVIKAEFSSAGVGVKLEIDLTRLDQQFQKAQYELDAAVMTDMIPYMPMDTGDFINLTKSRSDSIAGSGKVIAAAPPYGRFLYMGKVMVDESTGSPWARKGAKKVLVSQYAGKTNAKENIDFSKSAHGKATAKWFEEAKKNHGRRWVEQAKKTAGGR